VAPNADFSLRLVAAAAADTPLPKAGQCPHPGDTGQMSADEEEGYFLWVASKISEFHRVTDLRH